MKRFIQILLVIVAGETIFMLPFLIPRLLRPLMLESWDLTNQDNGLAFFPSRLMLILVYGFFGVSTILLMWGALIKLAHLCGGGNSTRASAMGILDGARGLTAALLEWSRLWDFYQIFFLAPSRGH